MNSKDRENILLLSKIVLKSIPLFDMRIEGNYGEITINNKNVFNTTGPDVVPIMISFISGIIVGLRYNN